MTSLTPTTATDESIQNYWRGILPNPNDSAERRAKRAYKIRERLRRGVPGIMMQLSQNQQQAHRNNLSPFGRDAVERWNAVEAQPEVEVPQRTIIPRDGDGGWGAVHTPPRWTDNYTPHTIIMHHTVGDLPDGYDLFQFIRNMEDWHVGREFSTIGYNYLIAADGTIIQGRPRNAQGAHVALPRYRDPEQRHNHNPNTIGIGFIGTFVNDGDMPTPEAQAAAEWLINNIRSELPSITAVRAHNEMSGHEGNEDFVDNQKILDWIRAFNTNEEE